ncbi:asparagine synthetase B family protein, partial [Candidatus Micrarchaeota archaeon]|nr:asparagine synthetase B family protein [Candidatus Micrarchaeota archaeon]
GKKFIQRNWELQFVGEKNEAELKSRLFDKSFTGFIPEALISDFYSKFKETDKVNYSHPVSMLLTLSTWNKKFKNV